MANLSDDLTLRMRAVGARQAGRQVRGVGNDVGNLGRRQKEASKSAGLLNRSTGALLKPFHHLGHEARDLAKGVLAAGLAFGSVEGIKRSIETTDQLVKTTVKLHNQFGLTEESASGLAAVLQARDIDPAALSMGLTTLSKQLVAADHGNQKAAGGFRLLGIHMDTVRRSVASPDGLNNVFQTVATRMSEMHGSGRKAALGQQLLGRASRGLSPLLQEGALGLQQQVKWANEYGVTLNGHTIKSVEQMVAAQTQAQYAMLGLQVQLGQFAAPLVTKANLTLADIVRSFREGRPEGDQFSRTLFQLATDLKPLARDLGVVGGYLKDHPRLLQAAGVAYLGYRTHLLGLLTMAPKAYAKGLITGRAFGAGFRAGSLPMMAMTPGMSAGWGKWGGAAGLAAEGAFAAVFLAELPNLLSLLPLGPSWDHEAKRGYRDLIPGMEETAGEKPGMNKTWHIEWQPASPGHPAGNYRVAGPKPHSLKEWTRERTTGTLSPTPPIHTSVNINGKQIAKAVHRQAVKRKSVG